MGGQYSYNSQKNYTAAEARLYHTSEYCALTVLTSIAGLFTVGSKPLTVTVPASMGGLPYKKGGDARWEISNEPLEGTNLGVA